MHYYRSLWPDVEVLLGNAVKTSISDNKLLHIYIQTTHWKLSISFYEFADFLLNTKSQYKTKNAHLRWIGSKFCWDEVCLFVCYSSVRKIYITYSFHFIGLILMCVFKCLPKFLDWEDAYSNCLHLYYFSPLCVFKCVLKLHAWEDA